jgi:ATP-dependent RNA helicase DeaD
MIRGTHIKVDWLPVPDGNEIKKKHRERYDEKLLGGPVPSSEDVRIWAADLLQKEDAVSLVTRLLYMLNKKVPSGYDIRKELDKEMNSKDRYEPERDRKQAVRGGKFRRNEGRVTTVTLNMKQKNGWNVGRVLRSVCSALEVDRNEVCRITINEDDIKVDLTSKAMEKFPHAEGPLRRWGLVPADNGVARKGSSYRQSSRKRTPDKRFRKKETSRTRN